MKTRYTLGVFAALLAAVLCGAILSNSRGVAAPSAVAAEPPAPAAAPDPLMLQSSFPNVDCVGVPSTKCCMWQLEKKAEGGREAKYEPTYGCDTGKTMQGAMYVTMKLGTAGDPCDPPQSVDLIPDGSTLQAKGQVIRREDNFAHFSGEFVINGPSGKPLFTGRIETMDRVGSHHLFNNCEKCNPESHFEGWLVGRGTDALPNHSIRALISARGTVPAPPGGKTPLTGSLSGTFLKCP
jgi:hypothetical protein